MGFVVKNTTKWSVMDLLCPHSCRGCGGLGAVLCECCKNYIISGRRVICPLCKRLLEKGAEKCSDCDFGVEGVFAVGWKEGALAKLVADYKYQSVRACGEVLAELLDAAITLDDEVVVVPLPTVRKHIRERGFDHTLALAKKLAKRREWKVERVLGRAAETVQVGAKASERKEQAKRAYGVVGAVDAGKTYLLLDDIWTTGASMMAAVEVMRKAGATRLYVAVIGVTKAKKEGEEEAPGDEAQKKRKKY